MSEKKDHLRLGFVGAGFIGQLAHIANYSELDTCEMYALAEGRPLLGKKAQTRYGFKRLYANHLEMLEDPNVEAVIVVVPRPWTASVVLDCLKAGKHVFSEKPMAHSVAQAERLVNTAKKKKLVYSVGFMKRYDTGAVKAKEIINILRESGELGKITFARGHCFMGDSYCSAGGQVVTDEKAEYPAPVHPLGPEWMPGELHSDFAWYLNVYSHDVNLLRFLLGDPVARWADLRSRNGQAATLDFGDFPGVLESGSFAYDGWDEHVEVYFEKGRVRLEMPPPLLRNVPGKVEIYKGGEDHELVSPRCGWSWSFRNQAEAFVESVRNGEDLLTSGAEALNDMKIIEEIWRKYLETV